MEEQIQPKPDLVEMAHKRRHIYLLEKLQRGKGTSPSLSKPELKELAEYEKIPNSPGIVDTQEKVAKAFGVSVRTIQHWQRDGMPVTKKGDYDLTEIQAWRFTKKLKTTTKSIEKKKLETWDAHFREFRARNEEMEYNKRIGKLIAAEDVEQAFVQRIIAVKRGLLTLPRALAPQLVGLEMRQIENALRSSVEGLIKNFSAGGNLSKRNEKRNR